MNRSDLAKHLAAGLAGWHQLQTVQNLGKLSGEDTARSLAAQIINAQGRFAPATSKLPNNWGTTKKRIDVALLGRSANAVIWYGALEIKWPGESFDAHQVRELIVQDAMRLAFVETSITNAKLLIVGGNSAAITKLFDTPHPTSLAADDRRKAFNDLLSRDLASPNRNLTHAIWSNQFPQAGDRTPETVFNDFNGKLKTELLAYEEAKIGGKPVGAVFIWQCFRTRGTVA